MINIEKLKTFNHILVPVTTLQREVKKEIHGDSIIGIEVFERVVCISLEKVQCNPVLNFFNLIRFDNNRDKFTPREIRLDDQVKIIKV